jgi:Alkylmercury lyase
MLSPLLSDVRRVVFARLAASGAAPSIAAIAKELSAAEDDVRSALEELHEGHHLVLAPEGDSVRMAHPFSAAPMSFVLRAPGDDRLWWGGCAWDSFGIVAALGEDLEITTRCPCCDRTLTYTAGPETAPPSPYVIRVPRPAAEWWDDVVQTCTHIRIFCDEDHARRYVDQNDAPEGALVPARTMWELALTWYGDRLDPDYEPQSRKERQGQLADAGLSGEFWQLP